MSENTENTRAWAGGCRCGRVRYRVTLDASGGISCNCSMCSKKGTILAFVAEPAFSLESGADELGDYLFNTESIHHLFCRTCGVTSFARGKRPDGVAMVAINLRCLDGIELEKVAITHVDGKSR